MDDDNSWSIYDLDKAPEPPTNSLMMMAESTSGLSSLGGNAGLLSPRVLMGRSSSTGSTTGGSNTPRGKSGRRHTVSVSASASASASELSTPQQLHRTKSVGSRTRTWSAPGYSQHLHYSLSNVNIHPSLLSPPSTQTPPLIMMTTTTAAETPLRQRTFSVPDNPSSHHRSNNSIRNFRQRPSLPEPPSIRRYNGRRSGNNALSTDNNEASNLSLPQLIDDSPVRSSEAGGNKENSDEDSDASIRLEPGFLSRNTRYWGEMSGITANSSNLLVSQSSLNNRDGSKIDDEIHDAQPAMRSTSQQILLPNSGGKTTTVNRVNSLSSAGGDSIVSFSSPQHQQQTVEDQLDDSSHHGNQNDDEENDDDYSLVGWLCGAGAECDSKSRWKPPNMHQIATCVVLNVFAPCFWVWYSFAYLFPFFFKTPPQPRNRRQPTDRAILARLNILVGLFGLLQIASAVFFLSITIAPSITDRFVETTTTTSSKEGEEQPQQTRLRTSSNIWTVALNLNLLGVEAFILVVAAVLTVRVVRNVNLVGAIRYLWVLLWILPFEIYFNIGLYDYFRVTGVWVRQYWRDASLGWFREQFCDPSWSSNTLCAVPLGVNETMWCLEAYNSTSCSSIRNKAQKNTERWLLSFYYLNASFGLALICLLFLVVNTLEGIISKPLVQKSRQSNIPGWLSLPIVSCLVFGIVFVFAQTSVLNTRSDTNANWIGPLYLITAGLFLLSALLGWYISVSSITNTRHKRNKMVAIGGFVLLMGIISFLLIALFAASIAFSSSFVEIPLTDAQRGDLACVIDQAGSCTFCDLPNGSSNRCPEWKVSDVTTVIQTQAKSSAALAAILMLYSFGALRFGLGIRKHIRMYQIQYI